MTYCGSWKNALKWVMEDIPDPHRVTVRFYPFTEKGHLCTYWKILKSMLMCECVSLF